MIRTLVYLALGWFLIALVGGLAEVFDLTVMLPATTAVVVTHIAFGSNASLPGGLAIALMLGYLEDLHQGAPIGTMTLAYGLTFLVLRWTSARLMLTGWILRSLASAGAVLLADLLVYGILMVLAEPLGLRREALTGALSDLRWHVLATLLVAPVVWTAIDLLFDRFGLDERPPQQEHWVGRSRS